MIKLMIMCLVCIIGIAANVWADYVPVQPVDYTGSRSTPSEVTSGGNWDDFTIAWEIAFDQNETYPWAFSYTLTDINLDELVPFQSHFIIEVSEDLEFGFIYYVGDLEGPDYWGPDPSNPSMPETIYGVKLDNLEEEDGITISFLSLVGPIWGDFYAKGGPNSYAYNFGIGTEPPLDGPFNSWIPVPDTTTSNGPEPSALLLIGTGIAGLGILGRRKVRK